MANKTLFSKSEAILALCLLVSAGSRAVAQQHEMPEAPSVTRAGLIEAQEAAKAQKLIPLAPPRGQQVFEKIENNVLYPIFWPNGWSLKLGGLPTGAGFTLGPRYTRTDLLRDSVTTDTSLVGSTKLWWRGGTALAAPSVADGHLSFRLDAAYEDAASVEFYGEGPTSSKAGKSNFRREFTTTHFETGVHTFRDKLSIGYRIGGLLANVGEGGDDSQPSTKRIYSETNTPGLERQSHFVTGTSFADIDLTKHGFDNPSGFHFEVENTQFWDKTWGGMYSFDLLSTQGAYYFSFANGMRTLAVRARNETAFTNGNHQIPFYLQPTLGGSNDLRGYNRYRFYGNGSSLVNVEYRWPLAQVLEMAVFADGGNVYQRPGLIGLRHTRGDGGFGFRFKKKEATFMRIDMGISPEGVQAWFVFNPVFGKLSHSF